MKKRIVSIILVFALVLSMAACGSKNEATQNQEPNNAASETEVKFEKVTLKMSTIGTETNSDTQSARKLAKEVKEETNGQIIIEVYPQDQLSRGDMTKSIELLAQGTTDIMISSVGTLSSINEKMQISVIPFLFSNYEEASEVIEASGADYWAKLLAERGIKYVDYIHNGLRQITNSKRPIKTPADLAGLKIRVPGGSIYMDSFRALGADPVSMNWSEVFTALQQGTIDGQENGFTVTNSNNLFEVQKYLTVWNYIYEANLCIVNESKWSKLKPETQEYLEKKIHESCAWGRDFVVNGEEELKAKFIKEGMEVYELSSDEQKAFRDALADTVAKYKEKFGEEACAAFQIK